jgi:hypothetical protein
MLIPCEVEKLKSDLINNLIFLKLFNNLIHVSTALIIRIVFN